MTVSIIYDTEVTLKLAAPDGRAQLERVDVRIEKLIKDLNKEAEKLDPELLESLVKTTKRFAYRLNDRLPPSLDPAAGAEIRKILLGALQRLEKADPARPLDILDELVVRVESIRHIIRDALDEGLGCEPTNAQALSQLLVAWLPRTTRKQVAELLEVEVRTFHRWLHSPSTATPRLYLVARLVAILRHAWTSEGVIAWFYRPRTDLEGKRPLDVLNDPSCEQQLLTAARQGRAQHAA